MIILMKKTATKDEIAGVVGKIKSLGYEPHIDQGISTVIGIRGDTTELRNNKGVLLLPGVENVIEVSKPYKEASRDFKQSNTIVKIGDGDVKIGSDKKIIIAGPCSVESREQILRIAEAIKGLGADILRGGAFKPRTSPYSFQGLGEAALKFLSKARDKFNIPIVTEILDSKDIPLFEKYDVDFYQVGARNMKNYSLLKELGKINKPVLLKRGEMATINEFLLAAEYLLVEGNKNVVLCERGIRTFEQHTRYTLDLNAVASIKQLSHLPIIVDPSHGTGRRDLIIPMSKASLSCGADGLMIEVHNDPSSAMSDAWQQLSIEDFASLMKELSLN